MTAGARDLEHDIEASRAQLDGTFDRLQARLNPSAIVDEVVGTARRSETRAAFYEGTLHAVRHNPLSVLLIAGGMMLLLRQVTKPSARVYRPERDPDVRTPLQQSV
ncbi:DUF3618 domain-containing protein [Methylobacterium sp. J-001]|uniref:DUF3618 domain-containing protein n=1 Tax=Methylobacterium sp. J-001 TaxID=2836609 RepID=UPI001FB864B7|nr:DUF3618 domain-containing protein [Methylobacterium sp. J-001]MCJ2115011.1 DUF3618 domain-containing protein [Methylobacterium sp. J-001]